MPVGAWRERSLILCLARVGVRLGAAGLLLLGANKSLQNAVAEGDTRTISFHHVHTDEDITVTFKRNGRYDEAALKKLDWFMRDWRRQKATHMDPHLFDLLWETYRDVGGTEPIQVICGFRSPETNAMLRRRSSGVAQFSQHVNGNAIDFYIPGVPLAKVRAEGLRLQRGGVGFYPTSGSPFVHMDTGSVRHWPRIAREQLVKIFPNGRTVHIPSDGHPLPGYALALADVERHGAAPSETSLEAARAAGVITASQEHHAAEKPKRSLLARLFGFGKDEAAEESEPSAPKHAHAPLAVAGLKPSKPVAVNRVVPARAGRPKPAEEVADAKAAAAATMANKTFDDRSYWTSAAEARPALPTPLAAGTRFELAQRDPASTGSTAPNALAYAEESETASTARARPMGSHLPRMPAETRVVGGAPNAGVALKPPAESPPAMGGGVLAAGPWLRAAMLTPSVRDFMTMTRVGAIDPRWQYTLLHKPAQSLAMTFSADPQPDALSDRFTGSSVVFLTTAAFSTQTASLR